MKKVFKGFADGLVNIVNNLANKRNPHQVNQITAQKIDDSEIRALIRTGLGSKILRIKASYALNYTLFFTDKSDKAVYEARLQQAVKEAAKMMLAWGRACIVLVEENADLSKPRTNVADLSKTTLQVLTPDIIFPQDIDNNLRSPRFNKPKTYSAKGVTFHHTRVIDFTYVKPSDLDLPLYFYGGVSEFELIRSQIVNDGIVERATGHIVEKNATVWHKISGFKESIRAGQDEEVIAYYSALESVRSIYGAGIIDAEDDVISVDQVLSNLSEVDQITLRRLAMVTGIPLSILIGENVKGLNSSGENERSTFQDTIENLQSDYLLNPINALFLAFGIRAVTFKENQGGTALERMEFETKAIDNALKLYEMGEDYRAYLLSSEVIEEEPFDKFFGADNEDS